MDLLFFIQTADATKVRIGERQRDEDEPKLLETTVRRVVPLLPVASDRSLDELEASVDKLFDERGSGEQAEQGNSRQKTQKTKVADAGEPSHPTKKLWDDYGASGGPTVGGKSLSSIQRSLAGAVENANAGITPKRFVISSNSSNHLAVNIAEAEVDLVVTNSMSIITSDNTTTPIADPAAIAKEKLVGSFVFGVDSPLRTKVILFLAAFLIVLAKVAKAIRLRAKTSKLEAAEKSLLDEVTALNEHNTILKKERNALDVKVTNLQAVVVHELQVSSFELKEKLSNYKNLTKRLEEFQDAQLKVVNDKFDKLYADFVEVTLHLGEWFYSHLLTTIVGPRWLVTHGMKLAIAKCLNSPEYLLALGIVVSKAIEKDGSDAHARRIRENIMSHRYGRYFWCCAATADLSTALSVTLASTDTVTPISVDDYEVMGTDD
uniref:Uncharacterized protein n=1 Tax=Tanacetum cinerariifolium TaxID=118510 RepID=A0A6L2KLU2_TANCI|nr:hypothetical protein [Tanacetum cinerariifolium]